MYDDEFVIRDFVKQNAEEWTVFSNLCFNLGQMNNKICYESAFKNNDVGHLSEYLALAFIKFWNGNAESAARMAEGIKMFIESEEKENV